MINRRFASKGSIDGIPLVLETIALHYFGEQANLVTFTDIKLPNYGTIDFVLARHKPGIAKIDDFIPIEFRAISPVDTDHEGRDTSRRFLSQVLAKGIVYEAWGVKAYWVIQESVYANLVERYGLKPDGFLEEHALRFALHDISAEADGGRIKPTRYVSVSVDEIYHSMHNDSGLPSKGRFIASLNDRLRRTIEFGIRMKLG